jgi:hypothetical protein
MSLTPLRPLPVRTATSDWFAPDSYLTDGRRLLRTVTQVGDGELNGFTLLEDCLTLEVISYLPADLAAMDLRPVSAAA